MNHTLLKFVDYNLIFLNQSWIWLNDKEIKELTYTPDFTKEQQLQFYDSLNEKKDYYIKGIEYNKIPIGACGLKNITSDDAEYWGYIGEKEYWGYGLGKGILNFAINAATEHGLTSLYLNVVKRNKRAIGLYEGMGFMAEEETPFSLKMRLDLEKKNEHYY